MLDWSKYGCEDLTGFFEFCRNLEYGWADQDGKRHHGVNDNRYYLQSPADLLESRIGICWDQTELQRAWFETHGYEVKTYLLYYELSEDCWPSHSILVYRDAGKFCWFEPMFNGEKVYYCGIHKYDSLNELLGKLRTNFTKNAQAMELLSQYPELSRFQLYEYERPTYGLNDQEFYRHCLRGRRIELLV